MGCSLIGSWLEFDWATGTDGLVVSLLETLPGACLLLHLHFFLAFAFSATLWVVSAVRIQKLKFWLTIVHQTNSGSGTGAVDSMVEAGLSHTAQHSLPQQQLLWSWTSQPFFFNWYAGSFRIRSCNCLDFTPCFISSFYIAHFCNTTSLTKALSSLLWLFTTEI